MNTNYEIGIANSYDIPTGISIRCDDIASVFVKESYTIIKSENGTWCNTHHKINGFDGDRRPISVRNKKVQPISKI